MSNFLYIPELDNLAINMDDISQLYIHDGKLHIRYISKEAATWHRIDCKIEQVQYRLDMFFFGGSGI